MERGEESSLALEKLPGRHFAASSEPCSRLTAPQSSPAEGTLRDGHVAWLGWRCQDVLL